jgi:hypothetical protein
MRAFGTLLLALILSGLIAGAVQVQLGVAFKADVELIIPMVLLVLITPLTTVVLGIAHAASGTVATIDRAAMALLGLAVLAAAALLVWDVVASRALTRGGLAIIAEIAVPLLVMIAIQWWLVRRRAGRAHGA